jgi:2-methylcitrate dehydratase PrpD
MTVARDLADFLTRTKTEDLPPQTMLHAAMIIASTLASAACGTTIQSAQIIRDLAREQGGRSDATIWFDAGPKLPVAEAARVNAMFSDAAASDDSDLRNIVHAGTPLTATALALAERTGADGQAVLAAIVLGYEAAGRISEAVTPGFRARGFHGCHGAVFAAAVAASRLLGLDAAAMAQSIAIAATSIGGLATAADTSVAREYHAGLATQLGINAALAAQRGYLVEEAILETKQGFFETIGGVDGQLAAAQAISGLGESWDIITDMAIKLMPGGHPYHAFAEAAGYATQTRSIRPADIATITLSRPGFTALTGPLHPASLIDMAHSPAYFAAAGAADYGLSWQHATLEKIADPVIHALIDKVVVGAPPAQFAERYRQGAMVTITMTNEDTSTSIVYLPKGAAALGLDWADIDAKYRALMPASGLNEQAIEASLAVIHDFQNIKAVSSLLDLLR